MEETDYHLFFTCNFARAAWFIQPWYIRVDLIVLNTNSITDVISNLLNMHHPQANLPYILTFMWCLWKSRNDALFQKIQGRSGQIYHMANALTLNLELSNDLQVNRVNNQARAVESDTQVKGKELDQLQHTEHRHRGTIKTLSSLTGTLMFSDAAFKENRKTGKPSPSCAGIGIHCQIDEQDERGELMIQATIPLPNSVLEAEFKPYCWRLQWLQL
jgi:hypothetical protein